MNKRQWKKKYKKMHGYNPPTVKQINQYIRVCEQFMEQPYKKCAEQFKEGIIKMAETIKGLANSISTMQLTKCTYPNKVCANMTLLNGIAYCDSVPCNLKKEVD